MLEIAGGIVLGGACLFLALCILTGFTWEHLKAVGAFLCAAFVLTWLVMTI